ncbi:MAG: RnfABCDGE type electron transport complex subunit D [SAR324 cluster bacterium]|nr:RnfABCDGE type electron transport complex subunit D [SAR324 cluster bacterium]
METVEVRTSPHVHGAPSVATIMRNVVYALLPICIFATYQFGLSAVALIIVTTLACIFTESFFNRISGTSDSLGDFSAVITGVLLALTLPPGFPLWMAAVAGFIAIALGKKLFGGLGFNVFNPALVGRAFVQAAFPVAITTWTPSLTAARFTEFIPSTLTFPFAVPAAVDQWNAQVAVDAFSGATPLALSKFENIPTDTFLLLFGTTAGSAGETSALLILLCGLYLIFRNMLDWRIPAAVLLGAFLTEEAFHLFDSARFPDPWFMLFSGGLMLGAMFMASDMVGSPVTPVGVWIFGLLIGFLTIIIRLFGGLNEGIMYAILLGNAASPLIDAATQPRVYGVTEAKIFGKKVD